MHSGVQKVVARTNMLADTAKVVDEARDLERNNYVYPITFAEGFGELGSEPYGILEKVIHRLGGTRLRATSGTQRRFCASAEASRPWIDVGQGRR
jgi:hypothetical protein